LKRFGIATEKCRNKDDKFNDQVMVISCGLWIYHLKYCWISSWIVEANSFGAYYFATGLLLMKKQKNLFGDFRKNYRNTNYYWTSKKTFIEQLPSPSSPE